jgi:glycine cleavage system H lipoate-binding protein
MVAILVVLTIVLFIGADLLVQRSRRRRAPQAVPVENRATAAADVLLPGLQPERFALPGGLFFHPAHTWANLLFSGQVKVGVDDFLQKLFGRIDAVTLPPVGTEVKQGQPLVTIRQGGRTALLPAPVDGVVCAVNSELGKAPNLLRREPYTRGWLVALHPTDLTADLSRLVIGEGALTWLKGELARLEQFLRETLAVHQDALVGATAADGGLTPDGLLECLDEESWKSFQSKFLGA